jgi:hypothetical protein
MIHLPRLGVLVEAPFGLWMLNPQYCRELQSKDDHKTPERPFAENLGV